MTRSRGPAPLHRRRCASRTATLGALVALVVLVSIQAASAASLTLGSQAFAAYRTCTLTATPSTTTAVIDSTVRQSLPTGNSGTATTLTVSSAANANQRTYLQFDLVTCNPDIPSTAVVRLATLRLYVTALPAVCRTIDIFRVGTAWTEAGITWNNEPFGAAINNPATGSRTDSFDVGTPVGCENRVTAAYTTGADVTTDVAAFVAGSATNAGWMLRDDVEGSATVRTATFSSKNANLVAQAPQLVVTYVAVP